MQFAPYFNGLCNQYKGKALFAGVYIAEAHAADEWPVGARISFLNQTRTVGERSELCKSYCKQFELQFPMLVDTMADQFMDLFAAWPFRFYVIQSGKVVFKAMPDETTFGYDVSTLGEWLAQNVQA